MLRQQMLVLDYDLLCSVLRNREDSQQVVAVALVFKKSRIASESDYILIHPGSMAAVHEPPAGERRPLSTIKSHRQIGD